MKEIMNIQQWWDSFHPIDRKSICLHFDLQEYLANKDYHNLPPHIKVMLMNQWISNDSIVHNTTDQNSVRVFDGKESFRTFTL